MKIALLTSLILAGTSCDTPSESATVTGPAIVESHKIQFSAPPRFVPTQKMPDGPLLGNGDIGVVVAGNPEALRFHIGKNDFWGIKTQAPMAVGKIQIHTPVLAGATYQAECDMRRAHWQGTFAKDAAKLTTRAWVDANSNRFFIELANGGTVPLAIAVMTVQGSSHTSVPAGVAALPKPAVVGCEQHGNKRWFFHGEMADLKVEDGTLSGSDITKLAQASRGEAKVFDGRTIFPLAAPAIGKHLSITGWIKIADFDAREANYLVSTGEWNQGYSLGLSRGHLRFAVNGQYLQSDAGLPKNQWIHVAAVFEGGKHLAIYLDGKTVQQAGGDADAGLTFCYDPDAGKPNARKLGMAVRILGADSGSITLAPQVRTIIAAAILTDLVARDPLPEAQMQAAALTPAKVAECAIAHQAWWEKFWEKSFVEIPDKVIEQHWYTTQYIMASCSRPGKVAPGLWGNWITCDNPAWHGDYHLNYNFQAPYYSVYSANHAETSLPFYEAMNQMIPFGRKNAAERGWKGIHLPVSMGPWGMCPEGGDCHWGQRSNAAYAALLYGWHWRYTQDKDWLKNTGYTYMREVEKFWTDYLKLENGPDGKPRYVIEHDAIHEGSSGAHRSGLSADFNPILTLGLVRALYRDILDMSEALNVDGDLRPQWRDILQKISAFPTQERGGKTVFRYTEKGMAWYGSNTLGIQHIFPSGAMGLDSDPALLKIAHNMLDAMARWADFNGSSSWYTACARVGYQPEKILTEMRRMYDRHSMSNKILNFGGGGIENVSPSLAVNEMLLQSHEGVLRFFPCWPKNLDARFGTLRAAGAFLVSAEQKNGEVRGVRILSEKGRDLTVQNPWPGKTVRIMRDGKQSESTNGDRFTIKTTVGQTLDLQPSPELPQ